MSSNAVRTFLMFAVGAIAFSPAVTAAPSEEKAPAPPEVERIRVPDDPKNLLEKAQEPQGKPNWLMRRFMPKISVPKLRYYFVAQNAHNCDLLYGLVQDNPLLGRAQLDFFFPNGCDCHGVAQVTSRSLFGGAAGQKGYVRATCSDGRVLTGRFETESLTTGHGTVSDTLGSDYQFTFGQTANQAVAEVNELRKKLGCPECTGAEVELKVQGTVIIHPSK
jgi:hypothetical protein